MMMALVGFEIRARLETRKLGLHHVIPIVIGLVGAVGLLLAVLRCPNSFRDRSARPVSAWGTGGERHRASVARPLGAK